VQPAAIMTLAAQAMAAFRRRLRRRLFMKDLIPTGLHGSIERNSF